MAEIRLLNSSLKAIVDDSDVEFLSRFVWYAKRYEHTVYASTAIDGKVVTMHRLLFQFPSATVDHIDGNGLNNQKTNLRLCSKSDNLKNKRKSLGTTSRFKGVYWNSQRRKWQAQISVNNQTINLGRFSSEEEAAEAYNIASEKHYGVYGRRNVVQ